LTDSIVSVFGPVMTVDLRFSFTFVNNVNIAVRTHQAFATVHIDTTGLRTAEEFINRFKNELLGLATTSAATDDLETMVRITFLSWLADIVFDPASQKYILLFQYPKLPLGIVTLTLEETFM
jgi:hypothetical protein